MLLWRHVLGSSALLATVFLADADFDCSVAPDQDTETACVMIQEWDSSARKEIRRRQAFGGGSSSSSTAGVQDCRDLQCLCQMSGNRAGCGQRAYRREYRQLTDGERQRFHNALVQLKNSGEYDRLSGIHRAVGTASGAHSGPGFLPWHREYMKRLEFSLRAIDPSIALPYWDSVLDSYLPDARDSVMFTQGLMGDTDNNGNLVFSAFNGFRTLEGRANIIRHLGFEGRMFNENNLNAVYSQSAVQSVMAYTAPQSGCPFPTNFQALEYSHSSVHLFIGGDMKPPSTSANDPIFFLHHSFVDLIWETWRQIRQNRNQRENDYPPDNGACANAQHFSYAQMRPWNMVNRDGLANYYTDNLFSYAPRPTCSHNNPNGCGSQYLFCDTRGNPHCVSKIKMNGRCNDFEGLDSCYGGSCIGGVCRPGTSTATTQSTTTAFTTQTPQTTRTTWAHTQTTSRFQSAATQAPHTMSAGFDSQCYNDDPCCAPWSRIGECRTNLAYMSRYCRRSCGYCQNPTDNQGGCVDRHPSCTLWSRQNYCAIRRVWMSENCQRSCGLCSQSQQQLCQASAAAGRKR